MRALLVLLAGLGISDAALAEDDPAVSAKKARALDRIDVAAPRLRGLAIIDTAANRADMPDADFSRWVAPADLAAVIAFLLSPAATAVTGALLPVTGRV